MSSGNLDSYAHLPPWLGRLIVYWHKHAYFCVAPFGFIFGFYLLSLIGVMTPLENMSIDARFQARAPYDPPSSDKLMFVPIDEASLRDKHFGQWPWPRHLHGDFLQLLSYANPAVEVFDLLFVEPAQDPRQDQVFSDGMAAASGVVLGATSEKNAYPTSPQDLLPTTPITHVEGVLSRIRHGDSALYPVPVLRSQSHFGFVDSDPNGSDGIRRLLPMIVRIGENVWPSLATQALMQYWKITPDQIYVRLGHDIEFQTPEGVVRVPINDRGEIWINYRNQSSFTEFGYRDLLLQIVHTYKNNEPWPDKFPKVTGRILFIGQKANGLSDLGPSPLDQKSPLAMVHMNVLNTVFKRDFLTVLPDGYFLIAWLLIGYLSLTLLRHSGAQAAMGIPLAIVFFYVIAAFAVFWLWSIVIPLMWPTLSFLIVNMGAVVRRWLEELKSKQQIKSVFASYISPGVMNNLLKDPESVRLGGQRKPVTIFFSDIRGFTSFSEGADEQELVRHLNEYFEKMVPCVTRYDGTLHKYIGDAIMAVWGDVIHKDEATDAKSAVRCSLAMKKELVALNKFWRSEGRMELKIGIGLNNGIVCVGNIGATQRKEFSVIGDAVNTASRLEGVTKQFHTDFCIGESIYNLLGGEFLTRTLGNLIVKGRTKPLRVYEVLDDLKGIEPMNFFSHDWARRYEAGFEHYLARDFKSAAEIFSQCLKEKPGDYLSEAYLEEAQEFIVTPPGPEWNGVIKLTDK